MKNARNIDKVAQLLFGGFFGNGVWIFCSGVVIVELHRLREMLRITVTSL